MIRVLSIVGVVVLAAAASGAYFLLGGTPEGPEQPIEFYHSVHAGENQIPCMYCHYTADRSPSAGIPSVKLCVGCHVPGSATPTAVPWEANLAFPTADRDSMWRAEAEELVGYWRRQEPIPWVRIHDLPQHVKFPHSMHINAGLQCQTCHGPVQEMERVYQFSSLQMGWCVDCHRGDMELSAAEQAAVERNSSYRREVMALQEAGNDVAGVSERYPNIRASIDCTVCHY